MSMEKTERTAMEYQQLQDEIKNAMKARDNARRDILRQVHTELKSIEVNERREVTEADVDAILKAVPEIVDYLRNMSPLWKDKVNGKRVFVL